MSLTAELHTQLSEKSVSTSSNLTTYLLWLGIIFASAGQAVLLITGPNPKTEGGMQALAAVMLVIGGLMFGVSTIWYRFDPSPLDLPLQPPTHSRLILPGHKSRIWLLMACNLALITIYLFAVQGETPLIIILWLASIGALFVSQIRVWRLALPNIDHSERWFLVGLGFLLAASLVTSVYHLTTLPFNLDGDFASVGLQARALATGQQKQIFAFGWAAIPILGYSPAWLSMTLFGTGLAGLNASGVVEGMLMIIGVYLLGRDLYNTRVGFFAAALLTVSYTHLAASRQSVYIDPVLFMLFANYFLLIGLRQNRGWAVIVSGILSAFCLQLYYSGRLVIPIILFVLFFLIFFHRTWLWPRLGYIFLWVSTVLITLGPMLLVFVRSPEAFMERTNEVFIFNPEVIRHTQGVFHVNNLPAMLLEQAHRTLFLFNYFPDRGTQFGLPLPFLDPITATLFILGLGFAFYHWRCLSSWLLLSWITLGLLIGCFLTVNAPFWPRLLILLPPSMLLAAIALNLVYEVLHRSFSGIRIQLAPTALLAAVVLFLGCFLTLNAPLWLRLTILLPPCILLAAIAINFFFALLHPNFIGIKDHLTPVASLTVLLLLVGLGWRNWNLYVQFENTYATARSFIARYLEQQPLTTQAHLVSSGFGYQDREFEFLAPGHLVDNLTPEQVVNPLTYQNPPRMIILTEDETAVFERLHELYPGASFETRQGNNPAEIAFYVVQLP